MVRANGLPRQDYSRTASRNGALRFPVIVDFFDPRPFVIPLLTEIGWTCPHSCLGRRLRLLVGTEMHPDSGSMEARRELHRCS